MKRKLLLFAIVLGTLAFALPSQAVSPGRCTRQPVCNVACPTASDPESTACCCPSGTTAAGYTTSCDLYTVGICNEQPCGVFVPPQYC